MFYCGVAVPYETCMITNSHRNKADEEITICIIRKYTVHFAQPLIIDCVPDEIGVIAFVWLECVSNITYCMEMYLNQIDNCHLGTYVLAEKF